jgi:hypothetical protein
MSDLPDFALPPEVRKSNSAGKTSPKEQGSTVPLGWKPTMQKPLPSVQCTANRRDGHRCEAWSLAGATVCLKHGGNLPNVKTAAEARKDAARLKIIDMVEDAAEVVEYLMLYGTQEQIRLKAATEVLDRAGIKGGADITVDHQHTLAPSKVLGDKLEEMATRLLKEREKQYTSDQELDIIESEVVPEVEEQDNLTNE